MAYLPGARQERFTAEETDVLVRAVERQRSCVVWGWEKTTQNSVGLNRRGEIATIVSSAGIPRTSHQCRKRYNDIRRRGKSKLASINRARRVTGGGSSLYSGPDASRGHRCVHPQPLKALKGFGGFEIAPIRNASSPTPRYTNSHTRFLMKIF